MPVLPEISYDTSIFLAFILGAFHVLEPAHGRSIIHALLVGSRGSKLDVVKFGSAVMVSHLGLATVLAVIVWFAGERVGSQVVAPAFKIIGSLATVGIGVFMLTCGVGRHTTCVHKHHGIEFEHDPAHEEIHARHMLQAHVVNPTILGVTGGLIPCQGTIALITLAVGAGRLQSAIWLLLSFALGLGLCLMVVGLITAMGRARAESLSQKLGGSTALALAPGVVVALMGLISLGFSVAEITSGHVH
ncbi:MAG: sulfite exporter TauE/SafE family protein [Armatimonadetes bacterium]|nr:sulfite exporter TauE/SafE family protein [Armatimonadota bacterium]